MDHNKSEVQRHDWGSKIYNKCFKNYVQNSVFDIFVEIILRLIWIVLKTNESIQFIKISVRMYAYLFYSDSYVIRVRFEKHWVF